MVFCNNTDVFSLNCTSTRILPSITSFREVSLEIWCFWSFLLLTQHVCFWRGLEGGLKPSALKGLRGCLKGAWRGLQGGFTFKGASRGLEGGFKGASRGLEGAWSLQRWRELRGCFKGASRGLERGFKGAWSLQRWKELRGCLKGASRGLDGGFKGASSST